VRQRRGNGGGGLVHRRRLGEPPGRQQRRPLGEAGGQDQVRAAGFAGGLLRGRGGGAVAGQRRLGPPRRQPRPAQPPLDGAAEPPRGAAARAPRATFSACSKPPRWAAWVGPTTGGRKAGPGPPPFASRTTSG